jgi:hypothetical protein
MLGLLDNVDATGLTISILVLGYVLLAISGYLDAHRKGKAHDERIRNLYGDGCTCGEDATNCGIHV